MRKLAVLGLAAAVLMAAGCANTEISSSTDKELQQQFSRENYEKEMIRQGKGAELEQQKAAEAARNAGRDDSQSATTGQ